MASPYRDTTTSHLITTDADFRTWVQAVQAAFAAMPDLVQTGDTGQINSASVTKAATNTDAGYEIWRFDDAEQSTWPIYFKVRYGTGATTSKPRLILEVGEGSNGSGTLTGTVMDSSDLSTAIYTSGTPSGAGVIHASQANGALLMSLYSVGGYGWFIERRRGSDDALRDGWTACYWGASAMGSRAFDGTTEYTNPTQSNVVFITGGATSGVDSGDVNLGAIHPHTKGIEPMCVAMIPYKAIADIADGTTGTVAIHGDTKSYRAHAQSYPGVAVPMLLMNE